MIYKIITLKCTISACPLLFEGLTEDKQKLSIYYRLGYLSMKVGKKLVHEEKHYWSVSSREFSIAEIHKKMKTAGFVFPSGVSLWSAYNKHFE